MRKKTVWIPLLAAGITLLTPIVHAAPNAGAGLRQLQDETQQRLRQSPTTETSSEVQTLSPSQAAAAFSDSQIMVEGFSIAGVSLFSEAELREVLSPFSGQVLKDPLK
ncbi:hypothetical protein [Pseudomonas anguilliseptica]|uniref:Uncharacterized protein n=1 Tax=Pseudomonas anguilliseptica TaxID=53406 RepID=A0A1H4RBP9_PSEAG|nr:hypothetical protein [Pseudomonas anguilliseptica]SEC29320.1 hypothetical protein SAMN05421553_0627 [Pseudomonas anguilliseptica]